MGTGIPGCADEAAKSPWLAEVAAYYAGKYRTHGDFACGMDWRDEASQRLRFVVLTRRWAAQRDCSVLDVGCGNGELLAFLRERDWRGGYHGVDVCPEMVEACRRRFGVEAATLASTADLAAAGLRGDWVVASGTFNVKQATVGDVWRSYLQRALREMFAACRAGVAFNIMSTNAERRYPRLFYLDPADVSALASACGARQFAIDHDYPLFEMTVTLLR